MANVCLPAAVADRFKQSLTSGEINPAELAKMSSKERHEALSKVVGEGDAKNVNSLFESKLLLKNQQQGYVTWAKQVAGITPQARRDLISRIQRMDKVLDPGEEDQFLHDLASTKLGVDVSEAETKQIANMAQKVSDLKAAQRADGTFSSEEKRLAYGRAKVDLTDYVNDLKHTANKTTVGDLFKHPGKTATSAAGLSKSIKASLDDSAIFRQGWKTMLTNPTLWAKNSLKTFSDAAKEFKGQDALREVNADVESRPNADLYKKAKLAVGVQEEAYPNQLPEKIPILGRAFKASESAYTGFLHRQRADVFDKYVEIAKRQGVDLDKEQLESMGKLVNALTGRGHLGKLEPIANTVNSVFFSPRNLKSNIDTLAMPFYTKGVTPFVRKKAAENLVKIAIGTTAVLAVADAVRPGSVELDPRSADFGKIKIGDTRFDVTGGMGSLLTLAARQVKNSTKSGGMIKPLGGGFGQDSRVDVLVQFLENKLSPSASVVKDYMEGQDFNGNKPTVKGEAASLGVPLPITNYNELSKDPKAANTLVSMIADGLGISVNTYGRSVKNWSTNPTKQQAEFQKSVSQQAFKKANQDYNQEFDNWSADHDEELQSLDPDQQQSTVNAVKGEIEDKVMKRYGFEYKTSKPSKDYLKKRKSLLKTVK